MEYYMDEKWKLSRDDPNDHSYSSSKLYLTKSKSQKSSTSKSPLVRSLSQKNSSFRSPLSRCSSLKSSPSKSSLSRSSSQRCADFTRKCGSMAKEQRAKFYIVKRCITMLLRWNKHEDSWKELIKINMRYGFWIHMWPEKVFSHPQNQEDNVGKFPTSIYFSLDQNVALNQSMQWAFKGSLW